MIIMYYYYEIFYYGHDWLLIIMDYVYHYYVSLHKGYLFVCCVDL